MNRRIDNEEYQKVIDWINDHDFFWVADFKKVFTQHTNQFLVQLRGKKLIQCSEVKKGFKQYYRTKAVITIQDIFQQDK